MIMPYNRVVKDLNGLTEEEFMAKIKDKFTVSESSTQVAPSKKGEFGMYLGKMVHTHSQRRNLKQRPGRRLRCSSTPEQRLRATLRNPRP